jgi:uncharacterized membrane protein
MFPSRPGREPSHEEGAHIAKGAAMPRDNGYSDRPGDDLPFDEAVAHDAQIAQRLDDEHSPRRRTDASTTDKESRMSQIEESITVDVPVSVAYDQWTQFEEFPRFMEHVEEIRQLDDQNLAWRVSVAGRTSEFEARITEQIPDARIAWTTTKGDPEHGGAVDFHRLGDDSTQIMVVMDAKDPSLMERAADAAGLVQRSVRGDLERFKELIEGQGSQSGAWRGEVRP